MRGLNGGWRHWSWWFASAAVVSMSCAIPAAHGQCLEDTLTRQDIINDGLMGYSVKMHQGHAYLGVPGETSQPGAVYEYQAPVEGEDWALSQRIVPSDGKIHGSFGTEVDATGNWLVVGEPGNNELGEDVGAVHVFRRGLSGLWTQQATLFPFTAVPTKYFGRTLAIDDDRIVVGAGGLWLDPPGIVHVFRFDSTTDTWQPETSLQPDDLGPSDVYAGQVDIAGDCIVVGAMGTTSKPGDLNWHGAVYCYRLDAETRAWVLERRLVPSTLNDSTTLGFGASVALDAERLAIGAATDAEHTGFDYQSSIHFFTFDRGTHQWAFDGVVSAIMNTSHVIPTRWVAIQGNTAVMSATFPFHNTFNAAWICKRDAAGVWHRHQFIEKPGYPYYVGMFGRSLSLDNDRLLIGDYQDDTQTVPGAVFIYQVDGPDCNDNHRCDSVDMSIGASHDKDGNGVPDECQGVSGDVNGDQLVNIVDLLLVIGEWGPCSPSPSICPADLNGDSTVNVADLLLVIQNWG